MAKPPLTAAERHTIDTIARYQFSLEHDHGWLDASNGLHVLRSRSGRIDRVFAGDDRLCTLTTHGRLTLGGAGGRRLHQLCELPRNRVVIDDEAVPYVGIGRNAFAKFVTDVDAAIRPRDEVLVVDSEDSLIAIGRAELSAGGMDDFERGMAVSIREGYLEGEPA